MKSHGLNFYGPQEVNSGRVIELKIRKLRQYVPIPGADIENLQSELSRAAATSLMAVE